MIAGRGDLNCSINVIGSHRISSGARSGCAIGSVEASVTSILLADRLTLSMSNARQRIFDVSVVVPLTSPGPVKRLVLE